MFKKSGMLQALQQRFIRATYAAHTGSTAGLSTEPAEFEAKYARLLQARDTLKKVESSLRLFLKRNHLAVKQAKVLGKALGTPEEELKKLGEGLNTSLEDSTLVQAISSKIQLLDDTVKQRRKLEDMRLVRDHHAQRLAQLKTKRTSLAPESPEISKIQIEEAKWQAKWQQSKEEYEGLLMELTEALDFIDYQTGKDGPWALIALELEAFRSSNQKSNKLVQDLFVGSTPGKYQRDPEAEKAAVQAEKEEEQHQQQQASVVSRPNPPKPPGKEGSDEEDEDNEEE